MFKYRKESTIVVPRRLIQYINQSNSNHDTGPSSFPPGNPPVTAKPPQRSRTNPGLIEIVTEILFISSFALDQPDFAVIANKNKECFSYQCQPASGIKAVEAREKKKQYHPGTNRKGLDPRNNTLPRVWKIVTYSIYTSGTS